MNFKEELQEKEFLLRAKELKTEKGYLDVVYSEKRRPYTLYPSQLCKHLFDKYEMKEGQTLLDVGTGRGEFAEGFNMLGINVKGIDREDREFEENKDDIVFSKSVIEHVKTPDKFMQRMYKILKPGGRVIIMTPDWKSQMHIFYDDYTHVQPYTCTGLEDLLSISGFKDSKAELFYQLPILWKHPWLKVFSKTLQIFPVKKVTNSSFYRWLRELMILASGIK